MQGLFTIICLAVILAGGILFYFYKDKDFDKYFGVLCICGLVIRVITAGMVRGYNTDISCFIGWSERLFESGFQEFYSSNSFSDYPPGYLYLLYPIALLRSFFGLGFESPLYLILLKLPAIICDILCGITIYKFAGKNSKTGFWAGAFFVLNPMVWLNSCMWGQVDSVFTLFILLALILLYERKYVGSALIYAVTLLIKPQAVIVFPIYLFNIIELACEKKAEGIKTAAVSAAGGALLFFALVLPFSKDFNPLWIFELYAGTLSSYEYATLNTPNLYGLFGGNGISIYEEFFGLTFNAWSVIFIMLICVLSAVIYFGKKEERPVFEASAFLVTGMYVLSAKMHERYFYPALALLLVIYILREKKIILLFYAVFTFVVYEATAWVLSLDLSGKHPWIASDSVVFILLSALCVLTFAAMTVYMLKNVRNIIPKDKYKRILIIMCGVYAAVAFWNLGDATAPKSGHSFEGNIQINVDLGRYADVKRISVFNGIKPVENKISVKNLETGEVIAEFEELSVYAWHTADLETNARYITLEGGNAAEIMEVALFAEGEERLGYTSDITAICDEQNLAAYRVTYKNSTYFDEIYHARSAWEYTHGIEAYEWTHPPLGKLIMSVGITLFGMNPFGWRFIGTVLGIVMIWLMYLMAYELFGSRKWGIAAAFLMMFDFMHFTQTRIATIDTYAVFFIMLMYLFMFKFSKTNYNSEKTEKPLKYLLWSGIFFGLGAASKWTCLYAGAGLAVIFFANVFMRFRERREFTDFWKNTVKIILLCVVFFVIIPILIYWVSYLPYAFVEGNPRTIFEIFDIQKNMLSYHADLEAEHFFSSKWYQWPIMYKPIWYFSGGVPEENIVSSISAFGNPAVWWISIPATVLMLWFMIKNKKEGLAVPLLILVGYLSQYLPWVGVSRVVFIYHYFTSVPFIILIIMYSALQLKKYIKPEAYRNTAIIYAAAVVIMFVMFYPAISGFEVSKVYMKNVLMWFSTWYFGG